LLSVAIFPSLSQSTFQYLYSTPYDEICRSLIEDNQGNLFFSSENFQNAVITKIDGQGNFIDSVCILNPNGTCNLSELIKTEDGNFVAFGNWSYDSTSSLWFVKLNYDLKVIDDKKLDSKGRFIFSFHHIINSKGNIILSALYLKTDNEMDVCIFEISADGQILKDKYFIGPATYNNAYSLLEDRFDNTYKIFAKSELNRMPCYCNIIDTNFNIISTHLFPSLYVETPVTAKWISNSEYILGGKNLNIDYDDWNLGIHKIDRTDSLLTSSYFGSPDTNEWNGLYQSVDFISNNQIYFAGTKNSNLYPFQADPSWIMLNILDSNLNLKSQHFYGGDAYYLVNAVLATQDSGCVLSCSRYDYHTQSSEYDIYILKVNKEGLLTSTSELPKISVNEFIIYPNPARDQVTVRYPDIFNQRDREVIIWNALGTEVKRLYRPPGQEEVPIDISGFPSGLYIAVLQSEEKKIAAAKFVVR